MRRKLHSLVISVATLLGIVAFVLGCGSEREGKKGVVWPISGTTQPDLPLSSTFGPRIRSEGVYDFHRGIDIGVPQGTKLHAMAPGKVVRVGNDPAYKDNVIQLAHLKAGASSCDGGGCYYSTYLHASRVDVAVGDEVWAGDVIGLSGVSASGFAHLHFEVRDEGTEEKDCTHPLLFLPYEDAGPPVVVIEGVAQNTTGTMDVAVTLTASATELDFKRIELVTDDGISGSAGSLQEKSYDVIAWNNQYTLPDNHDIILNDPDYDDIHVNPTKFGAGSSTYEVRFTFMSLEAPVDPIDFSVRVLAEDIRGNTSEATWP